MKRVFNFVLICCIGAGIRACIGACNAAPTPSYSASASTSSGAVSETTASQAPTPAPVPASSDIYDVTDIDGNPKKIQLTNDTNIIYMATWCPHSKAFKAMMNDPDLQAAIQDHKVIAIFGNQEWSSVRGELDDGLKDGSFSQAEYDSVKIKLKSKQQQSIFFDPTFFDDLTIPAYVGSIRGAGGYPSARFHDSSGWHSSGMKSWLRNSMGVSATTVEALYARYDPTPKG